MGPSSHGIRRFAEADPSHLLTILLRSSANRATNDDLLNKIAKRILDVGKYSICQLLKHTCTTTPNCARKGALPLSQVLSQSCVLTAGI